MAIDLTTIADELGVAPADLATAFAAALNQVADELTGADDTSTEDPPAEPEPASVAPNDPAALTAAINARRNSPKGK